MKSYLSVDNSNHPLHIYLLLTKEKIRKIFRIVNHFMLNS